jgi:hypothetical protein
MRSRIPGALALLALCVACTPPDRAGPPDCSETDCREQVDALVAEVESLEGVAAVEDVELAAEGPLSSSASPVLDMTLRISSPDRADCADYEGRLGRLAWESEVAPLGGTKATCLPRGTDGPGELISFAFASESVREQLEQEWGPRPGD